MPTHYLVIDLEATCADDGSIPREAMEIIEIGAVMVLASDLAVVDSRGWMVRPVRNRTLTDFCRQLTGIEQHEVDDAPTFPTALRELRDWAEPYPDLLFCSWGDYDRKQIAQDCLHHHVEIPPWPHSNLKQRFGVKHGQRCGMARALEIVGLPLEGRHHRGLDDARNIARLLRFIV